MPVDDANAGSPDLTASSIAQQLELLARARDVAKRIAERVQKVTGEDTAPDVRSLSPADAPTTEEPPLA